MAVKPIVLYDNALAVEYGRIYWNSSTAAFYSDENCQNEITSVGIPRRELYKFLNYTSGTGSATTERISATGVIAKSWNPGTSSSEIKIYAQWSKFSMVFTITNSSATSTPQWRIPVANVYRSTTTGTQAYRDDRLTDGPITKIAIPTAEGWACTGIGFASSTNYIDANGNILATLRNYTTPTSLVASLHPFGLRCYYLALNANNGHGGEPGNIYYNRVRDVWCYDNILTQDLDRVKWPTRAGYYCDGYNTKADGTGTKVVNRSGYLMDSAKVTANTTAYAMWKPAIVITLDRQGGSGATKIYFGLYLGEGLFYSDANLEQTIDKITPPTKANHKFLGYFYNGEKVIDEHGNIIATTASANLTVTAQWELVSYTVAIEEHGGTGISAIYANTEKTAVYLDEMCDGEPITAITPLVRPGYRFLGIYTTNDVTGVRVIDGGGVFTSSMSAFVSAITGNTTVYAIWQQVHTITLNPNGGAGAPGEIYYDDAFGQFYDTPEMTTPVTTIIIPSRECYRFMGFALGGTTYIDATGHISASWTPTADTTLTAGWERRSWRFGLDPNGGTGGTGAIYRNGGVDWYADDACAEIITHIQPPTRDGYTFAGFYANNDPAQVVVDEDGLILASPALTQANNSSKAIWTANTYTLTFDPNGGTTPTTSKSVTFGQPIGTLPTATRRNAIFKGWEVGGVLIDERTLWEVPANTRAAAVWELQFGDVVDYFAFASASLKPIASNSGDNKQRICVTHTGKFEPNVNATSGVWRNPSVTYVVTRNMTLNVTLGKAFVGSSGVSGFMITKVEVHTQVGQFPTVTISAVANEGRNAINQFLLSVNIVARSKAQNLMGAISGGGKLNAMSIVASCDPVVIAENMMPVASDVVHGKITASADTIIINHDSAPIASGGFSEIGTPKNCTDAYYSTWHIDAEKEM